MLMMLAVGAAPGKKEAQLMLMMLGVGAAYVKKGAQLMLMMLADAHDAVRECGFWESGPADAHHAGCGCCVWGKMMPS